MSKGRMIRLNNNDSIIDYVEYKIETPYSKGFYIMVDIYSVFDKETKKYNDTKYIAYLCHKDRHDKDFILYAPVIYKGIRHTYKDFESSIPNVIDDAIARYIENHFS